jgi:carbonic anhydrase/acetyltransferase-like protein (isoleucine patch superfamily)
MSTPEAPAANMFKWTVDPATADPNDFHFIQVTHTDILPTGPEGRQEPQFEDTTKQQPRSVTHTYAVPRVFMIDGEGYRLQKNGAAIAAGAVVSNSTFGSRTLIHPDAVVTDSTVGAQCTIAERTHIRDSKLGDNNQVGGNAILGRVVIGDGVTIGSGTTIDNAVTIGDQVSIGQRVNISAAVTIGSRTNIADRVPVYASVGADSTVLPNAAVETPVPPRSIVVPRTIETVVRGGRITRLTHWLVRFASPPRNI